MGIAEDKPNGKPCIVYSKISMKKFNQSPFKFGLIKTDLSVDSVLSGSYLGFGVVNIFSYE